MENSSLFRLRWQKNRTFPESDEDQRHLRQADVCLKYEQENYEELLKITPKIGASVKTPDGRGTVVDANLLTGVLSVRMDAAPDAAPHSFHRREVSVIRDGQIKVDRSEIAALSKLEEK